MKARYLVVTIFLLPLPLLLQASEEPKSGERVTFVDDVLPILEDKCINCHNPDESKGGLDLSTYSATLTGGSGGEIVVAEDPGSSRLFSLSAHLEEPVMPPRGTKASEKELKILSNWISGGILETSSSTARKSDKPKIDFDSITSTGKPEGPPAMPEHLLLEPAVVTERPNSVLAMAHSPWAPILAVAGQKQVLLYHSEDFDLLGVLAYPEGFPQTLSFSPNGAYLSCGGGRAGKSGNVVAWDIKTGERIIEVGKEYDCVLGADVSPDLKRAVMGGPGRNIKIWDTVAGEQIASIKKHTDWMLSAAYSPDGVIFATGGRGGDLYTWEAATGYEFFTLKGHTKGVTALSWRSDGNVLASSSEDGQIILWEMNEGSQVKKWNAHPGGALSVTFAPNGNLVSVGRDKTLKVWQGDGKQLKSIAASSDVVLSVAISHDTARAFSGDIFGNIKVWNVESGAELASINPNPPTIDDQLAYSEQRIRELTGELPKLKAGAETVSKELADARAALAKVEKNTNSAHQALKTNLATVAKMDQQIKALTTQVTQGQEAANAKNARVAKTTELLTQLGAKLKASQNRAATLNATIAKNEAALKAATDDALNAAKAEVVKPALPADQKQKYDQLAASFAQADKASKNTGAVLDAKARVTQQVISKINEAKKVSAVTAEQLEKRQTALASAEIQLTDAISARTKSGAAVKNASKDGRPAPQNIVNAQKAALAAEQQARTVAEAAREAVAAADAVHQKNEGARKQVEAQLAAANAEFKKAQDAHAAAQAKRNLADAALKPLRDALAAGNARFQKAQQNITAKTTAQQAANKTYQDNKAQAGAAKKTLADVTAAINQYRVALTKEQEEAKAATDAVNAKRGQLDAASKQLAAQREALKKAEATVANATKAKEAAQAKVTAIAKKEADTKLSIASAEAELVSSQFLVKKWEAAAINLTAHEESEELAEMTEELAELKEEETEAKAQVAEATQSRVDAEKTLANAKSTVAAGNQTLREKSANVLEHALELVANRAVADLREEIAEESITAATNDVDQATGITSDEKPVKASKEMIEMVAAETLAYKTRDELSAEVKVLRGRLGELESLLENSFSEADKTKATVDQAAKVARETPQVIAERSRSEQAAAREFAEAEAERAKQEQQLNEQQSLVEELRVQYYATVPKRN